MAQTAPIVVQFTIDENGSVAANVPPGVPIQSIGLMILILSRMADSVLDAMARAAVEPTPLVRAASIPDELRDKRRQS